MNPLFFCSYYLAHLLHVPIDFVSPCFKRNWSPVVFFQVYFILGLAFLLPIIAFQNSFWRPFPHSHGFVCNCTQAWVQGVLQPSDWYDVDRMVSIPPFSPLNRDGSCVDRGKLVLSVHACIQLRLILHLAGDNNSTQTWLLSTPQSDE